MIVYGHCVMADNFDFSFEGLQIETRLAFTRDTQCVRRHHFVLKLEKELLFIKPLAPFLLNKKQLTSSDPWT